MVLRRSKIILILIGSWSFLQGQIGVSGYYWLNDFPAQEGTLYEDQSITSFSGVGLSYWARLKKIRLEFNPTLSYAVSTAFNGQNNDFSAQVMGFHVPSHFYLLDFKNDCQCPTFSKEGEWIRKGFFAYVAPGVQFNEYEANEVNPTTNTSFFAEGGFGIDLGLTNAITITPMVGYRRIFYLAPPNHTRIQQKNNHGQIPFSLKCTFRWDKQNFYRRR